ncbi:LAFE_0E09032g1_1 [Lachancea fermentati]|uniref:LAFE_0E09032g1_1 n=1 Tax=Lachancea fermentati TaxID=4955 RepID=A0A1G4MDH1_LACFM|nr:LAFE_0E09032g1_1 [Lachancea fermentati]
MSAAETTTATSPEEVKEANQNNVVRTIVDPETTIFIGNVARDCTEEDLKNVFSEEVEVEIPSAKSGRFFKQRYAFVKFPSKIDFEAIKEKYDKTVVKERGIYIRRAQTEEQRDEKRKARAEKLKKGSDKGFARRAIPAPPRKLEKVKVPLDSMERSTDTLYVNNVPYYATKEQLAEFFGTKPDLIVLPLRRMRDTKTKRFFYSKRMNRGIAFVTFENCEDIAKKVEEFQGKTLNDRELAVDVAALKPEHEEESEVKEESEEQKEETKAAPAA